MIDFARTKWLLATVFFLSLPTSLAARQVNLDQVHILADPSLTIPLTQVARNYSREHNVTVTASFASTEIQASRIEQGTEADVFITTRESSIKQLMNQGLIDVYSQKELFRNRLVLATYKDNSIDLILIPKLPLAGILERMDPGFSFVIGHPDTLEVGLYSLEALRNHEMAGELEPHFLFIQSQTDVHKAIEKTGGYGIMLQTEVLRNNRIKSMATFPETSHSPILYKAMVVAGENMGTAREFVDYLVTKEAQDVFIEYGFDPIKLQDVPSGHLALGSSSNESEKPL